MMTMMPLLVKTKQDDGCRRAGRGRCRRRRRAWSVFLCRFWDMSWVTCVHQDTLAFRLHGPKTTSCASDQRKVLAGNAALLLLPLPNTIAPA